MSQNQQPQNQNRQQGNQQPQREHAQQQPAPLSPEAVAQQRADAEAKKARIQEAILKFCRRLHGENKELRLFFSSCELIDIAVVPRGLLVTIMGLSGHECKDFVILVGTSHANHMPRDAAETIAREWAAINESGALRS